MSAKDYQQITDLLRAELDPMKGDIRAIFKSLEGNGQPGVIQRLERLEGKYMYIAGGLAVFVFLFELASKILIK